MIRRPPRSTRVRSSAASDVYKRQAFPADGDQLHPARQRIRFYVGNAVCRDVRALADRILRRLGADYYPAGIAGPQRIVVAQRASQAEINNANGDRYQASAHRAEGAGRDGWI